MIDPIAQLRVRLDALIDEPSWKLLIGYDPVAPFGLGESPVPAVYATVVAPGAVLGRMCTHTEVLNPCDDWDDKLLVNVAHDFRQRIADMRTRQLNESLS